MKKVLFFAVAALALGLASCSETKKVDEAAPFIEQMKSQLEAGSLDEMEGTMDNAMAKVTELAATDPEAAKAAFAEIQNFIKESKEQLLAAGAEEESLNYLIETPADMFINALTAGQSVIQNAEDIAGSIDEAVVNKATELQEGAENAAAEQVEAAKQKATEQVDAAKKEANDKVNEATQKANEEVNKAAEKANQEMNDAAKKALRSVGL